MEQHAGLCLGDECPGTIVYDGARCISKVKKHWDEQHYVSSAATGEETPRDLPPLGQRGDWW